MPFAGSHFYRELGNTQHLLGSFQSWILDSEGALPGKHSPC